MSFHTSTHVTGSRQNSIQTATIQMRNKVLILMSTVLFLRVHPSSLPPSHCHRAAPLKCLPICAICPLASILSASSSVLLHNDHPLHLQHRVRTLSSRWQSTVSIPTCRLLVRPLILSTHCFDQTVLPLIFPSSISSIVVMVITSDSSSTSPS